jgi:hypothetical protein
MVNGFIEHLQFLTASNYSKYLSEGVRSVQAGRDLYQEAKVVGQYPYGKGQTSKKAQGM